MKQLKENLLIQFSVVSFVIMLAIAVILTVVLSNKIRGDAVDTLIDEAVGSSHGRLLNAITPDDLLTPMTGERYERFDQFIQQSIVSERTARVKIWGPDGTIVYMNDPAGVGERFPEKAGFQQAIAGENSIEIKVPDSIDNEREKFLGTLMELYTPIVFPGDTKPSGVFEIYQYYQPTALWIANTRNWLVGATTLGFLTLYVGLVSIVWRGWHTITAQRATLNDSISELDGSNRELRETTTRLERSNKELQDFAFVAAHDLQEPLRKVQAFGERLEKYQDVIDERGQDYLSRMQDSAARMKVLINDLLSYSRVTTKGQPFVPVDLNKISENVTSDLEVQIDQLDGKVEVDELPTIDADPTQIRQLMQNLISNALKFHQESQPPIVKIRSKMIHESKDFGLQPSNKKLCQITVEDNGIGFDEQYRDQIFTIFQRLHTREEYEGTGVGLAVCRKIVERHEGTIIAESTPGKGTTFTINLPAEHTKGGNPQ